MPQALATTLQTIPDGLVLAQPVLDSQAQLLLPAGSVVTTGVLRSLQQRGIQTVFVVQAAPPAGGAAQDGAAPPPPASHEATQARLLHLFRPALRLGQLNPLLHLILRYRDAEKDAQKP
ncbi:MAG: hypothetical protein LWW96_21840 [Acidovorax sp.]|uniref:hypothetical protein n=1 Tax=Acidovorax sp. TaxID=1872122 RepID=UPI0025B9CFC0|nr:hypothetical protein [Acidovorax sp.]MCE1194796.1 hypothetical protein [Acidovorax sp.]